MRIISFLIAVIFFCPKVNGQYAGGFSGSGEFASVIHYSCSPVNVNPYAGGSEGGNPVASFRQLACVITNVNPFLGGDGSGSANVEVRFDSCVYENVNPYLGGDGSSYYTASLSFTDCPVINTNPYLGGEADGHANEYFIQIICPVINTNPYLGGEADGHSNISVLHVKCPVINTNPYTGGIADGHAHVIFANVSCPETNINPFRGGIADGSGSFRTETDECFTLPVSLLFFYAIPDGDVVRLHWQTQSEVNSDYFTVERSRDGMLYSAIGTVKAAGHSTSPLLYYSLDADPFKGDSYYRLRQTDVNGNSVYVDPVHVYFGGNASGIFPNPAVAGQDVIFYHEAAGDRFTVSVNGLDGTAGRTIEQERNASMLYTIPTAGLAPGIYSVSLSSDNMSKAKKLVIVR